MAEIAKHFPNTDNQIPTEVMEKIKEAIEDRIKRWGGASKDYNDWLKHLAPKHRFGTTIYTQVKQIFDGMPDDYNELLKILDGYRLSSPCALCEGKEKEIAELRKRILIEFNKGIEFASKQYESKISELEAENNKLIMLTRKLMIGGS